MRPLRPGLFLLLVPALSHAQIRLSDSQRRALGAAIDQYRIETRMPAISVAIGSGTSILFSHARGLAQIENQVPATAATTFRSASTLKSMTATLILQQVAAGRIDLDGEIHRYCPQYPPQRFAITIRHLLLHQGGVRASDGPDVLNRDFYPSVTASLARFARDSLRFEPGTGMLYSNYGYVLLACALEGVTGKPYDRVLRDAILDPLGMTSTRAVNLYRAQPNLASSYLIRTADNTRSLEGLWTAAHLAASPLDTAFPADPVDPSFEIGAGSYLSTPSDMVRFVLALDAGKLLPDSLRRLELVAQPAPAGTTPRPIGWTTTTYGDVQVSQVFGSDWDGSFATVWDPADHLAIAVASNINWDQPVALVAKILSILRPGRR